MMKKTTITTMMIIASSLFASCTFTEWNDSTHTDVVSFSDRVHPSSKGTPVSGIVFPDGSFGVFAYYTALSEWSVAKTDADANFMLNQEIVKSGDDYNYSPVKYWPKNGGKTTFFAYAPYQGVGITLTESDGVTPYTATSIGIPCLRYQCPAAISSQIDLMYSDVEADLQSGSVNLAFHHSLSRVEFVARTSADYSASCDVRIREIAVNILPEAVFNPESVSWSSYAAATAEYIIYSDATGISLNHTTYSDLLGEALLAIPQDLSGATANLEVTYDVVYDSPALTITETQTLDMTQNWGANDYITYQLSISLSGVDFTAVIASDWTAFSHQTTIQ